MRSLVLAGCCILLGTTAVPAQSTPVRVGQWGVEAPIGGNSGTLLKFNDPRGAWLIGAGLTFQRVTFENPGGPSSTQETSLVSFRLGRRWYQRESGELRSFSALGFTGGMGTDSRWLAGIFGEFGISYFLNDRLNVGASGVFSAERSVLESPGGSRVASTIIGVTGPRVLLGFLF